MFLTVFLLMSSSSTMLFKSFLVSITSDESIAMSVPLFTLTPMSLFASAGLSFIPSPHIITYLFSAFSFFTVSAFWCGVTSAITSVIPISFAIFSAVCLLSPVSIIVFMPLSFSFDITSFVFSRITSFTPIIANTLLSTTRYTILFPLDASFSSSSLYFLASSFVSFIFSFSNIFEFPNTICFPSTVPVKP